MPCVGRTVVNLDQSKAIRTPLLDAKGEEFEGVHLFLRRVPNAMQYQLLKPALRAASDKRSDESLDAQVKLAREFVLLCMVDSEGFEWAFDTDEAVSIFAPFIPGLERGKLTLLDGKWTRDFARKFFEYEPSIAVQVRGSYDRMAERVVTEASVEEQGKDKPLPIG